MNMAERHEQAVKIRVGTRHPETIEFADGSRRTAHPVIGEGSGEGSGHDAYPNLVRVKTISQDEGEDGGGVRMQSQTIGDVINLPPVEDLADDEIVFVSALVVAALESTRGEWYHLGRTSGTTTVPWKPSCPGIRRATDRWCSFATVAVVRGGGILLPWALLSQSDKTIPGSTATSTKSGVGSHHLPKTERKSARLPPLPFYRRVAEHECQCRQDTGTRVPSPETS